MAECNLIVDSCCDLPSEAVNGEGVTLLKFPFTLNGKAYEDDLFQTVGMREFYDSMRKGARPSTSQVPAPALYEAFASAAESGTPAVYLSFSSGLSGSFDAAMVARDAVLAEHPDFDLRLVDTRLASIAEGLLVLEALRQRERGLTAAELEDWAETARYFVNGEFMVGDLDSLHRGGRIPPSVATIGSALNVKPLLNIGVDGRLSLVGASRGRKKGINHLVECYRKNADRGGGGQYAIIGHSDCPEDAKRLRDALGEVDEDILFLESNIGPVIGSHVGPDMLAVAFWGKTDKRESVSVADRIARKAKENAAE